jgi:hypothetical protein
LALIDYTFIQVLSANIQEAEHRSDNRTADRLKMVYQMVVGALQAGMPPELQFINEVLGAQSEQASKEIIAQRLGEFNGQLLEAIEAVEEQIAEQNDPVLLERLSLLRDEAIQAFG